MVPQQHFPAPGKSPMGMEMVPKYAEAAQGGGAQPGFKVDPSQVQNLGVTNSFTGGAQTNYAPARMWGAALTLIVIVMLLNLIARLIGRRNKIAN